MPEVVGTRRSDALSARVSGSRSVRAPLEQQEAGRQGNVQALRQSTPWPRLQMQSAVISAESMKSAGEVDTETRQQSEVQT